MMEAEGLVSPRRRRQGARSAGEEGLLRRSRRAAQVTYDVQRLEQPSSLVGLVAAGCGSRCRRRSRRGELYTAGARPRSQPCVTRDKRPTLRQIRDAVAAYERVVRRYPASGYADNALWQASELSRLAWDRFGEREPTSEPALRLLKQLQAGYPVELAASPASIRRSRTSRRPRRWRRHGQRQRRRAPDELVAAARLDRAHEAGRDLAEAVPDRRRDRARRSRARRCPTASASAIEMDREVLFRQERLDNPKRVFFDLAARICRPALHDKTLNFTDDIVREIRLGRHPQNTTRVVMDMEGVETLQRVHALQPVSRDRRLPPQAALPRRQRRRLRRRGARRSSSRPVPTHRCCRAAAEAASRVPPRRCPPPPAPVVDGAAADAAAVAAGGSADAARADGAARELERPVLAGAAARSRRLAHRHRRRPRRPRSRRARQRHQRVGARARRVAAAAEAAREAAGHRSRDDARHRRLHPARAAHGDRQPRGRRPVPVDSRQRQPQHQGARRRDLLPELRRRTRKPKRSPRARTRPPARRCTACRTSSGRSRSNNKIDESRDFADMVQKSMVRTAVDARTASCGTSASSRRRSSC